jgi:hypothetical protein
MSSFFDSELVQQEMEEINDLQAEIYKEAFKFPELSVEEKIEHLERLDYLLEKQEILYTRLKLSDDPRAKQVANNVRDSAIMMGFPKDIDCSVLFSNMRKTLESVREKVLDRDR